MTVLAPVVVLSVVAVYLACEHRLRHAVTVQDGRDRDDLGHARDRDWFVTLSPARFQALADSVVISRAPVSGEGWRMPEVNVTLTGPLSPFAAALLAGTATPTRWHRIRVRARRWRWRVGDWWERVVTDLLDGGSVKW